ncbi:hypothetical protein FQA47_023460 [Oryzias melastigma]|uniref:Interleukin-2 receptor subunit beta N-terminal domain-containing protein n=1 Tax=Oryzias melastigma TaxID=30732 RepID=A0A834C5A6_ORYME|nr:hypothetical protein FQA47_023460 [Oryzias melastigma]
MEKTQDILSLLLLLSVFQIGSTSNCSPHPDNTDLNCYSDYDSIITCMWNSTSASKHKDSVCRIDTKSPTSSEFKASCVLEPVDLTKPDIKKCSMVFTRSYSFTPLEVYHIKLNCSSLSKIQTKIHKPSCHVKVKAPGKPSINSTTVSWLAHVPEHALLNKFTTQLEWKQQDQSWSDPLVKKTELNCEQSCEGQLDPEMLTQGETYEAREEIASLQLIPTIDAVQVIRPEEKLLKENIKYESGSSGFSNPSYSALCPAPLPLLSQTSNDRLLCPPSGPEQDQQETRKTETDNKRIEVAREEILELLLKDSNIVTAMPVS